MSSRRSAWRRSRRRGLLQLQLVYFSVLLLWTTSAPWTSCHAFDILQSAQSWQPPTPFTKFSRSNAIVPLFQLASSRSGDDAFPVRVSVGNNNPQESISAALSSISTTVATPVFQNERVVSLPSIPSPISTMSSTTQEPATTAALSLTSRSSNNQDDSAKEEEEEEEVIVYQRGLAVIAFITLLFASNSPALHAAFSMVEQRDASPPVLLLNAACSAVALVGMLAVGPWLDRATTTKGMPMKASSQQQPYQPQQPDEDLKTPNTSPLATFLNNNKFVNMLVGENNDRITTSSSAIQDRITLQAGMELGTWKMLGTLLNIVGLSLTSAGHGAFLIQLTTLFVPLAQGFLGVPIPQRIWTAIALALAGVLLFTLDDSGGSKSSLMGDAACVGAAVLYATYDLRLFHWGQQVKPLRLITTKIITQTVLSVAILLAFAAESAWEYVQTASAHDLALVGAVTVWSGLAVNALAPYLQVGGQQTVGPARAQILYASQPLWAALLSFVVLGETVGTAGLVGGSAFLLAMILAATAELPNPDCGENICEV